MDSVIQQLYMGTLSPGLKSWDAGAAYQRQAEEVVKLEETLLCSLSSAQKELFYKLNELQGELLSLETTDNFVDGFRLGALFLLDILKGEKEGQ